MLEPLREVFASTSAITKLGAATLAFVGASILHSLTPMVIGTIVMLVLLDALTGLGVAIKKRRVSSKKWYRSLVKLANYSVLMIVGGLVGDIQILAWLSSTFLLLIVVTELISLIENISILEPNLLPTQVVKVLHLIKD